MSQLILIFLLFILPFFVTPFWTPAFEAPKVILAQILIEILALSQISNPRKFLSKNHLAFYLLLLGLFLLPFTHLITLSQQINLFGNIFRLQGVLLFWHLLIFSLISSQISLKVPKFLPFITLVILTLLTPFFGQNQAGRAVGTLGEPNSLAAIAIFFLVFILFKNKMLIKIVALALTLFIILITRSETAFLALLILSTFFLLKKIKLQLLNSFLITLLIILISYTLPFLESAIRSTKLKYSFESRSNIWQTSFYTGLENPIFGHGFGEIEPAIKKTAQKMKYDIQYQTIDSSHNFLLDYWIQGGILGLIFVLLILFLAFKQLILNADSLGLSILLVLITVLSFNPLRVTTLLALWWSIGRSFLKDGYI